MHILPAPLNTFRDYEVRIWPYPLHIGVILYDSAVGLGRSDEEVGETVKHVMERSRSGIGVGDPYECSWNFGVGWDSVLLVGYLAAGDDLAATKGLQEVVDAEVWERVAAWRLKQEIDGTDPVYKFRGRSISGNYTSFH